MCRQTIKPIEVIFVDGKSTDNTLKIVSEYTDKLPLKIIIQKNTGIGDARQDGFEQAKGEVIASTDADIVLPPDWVERIEKIFHRSKIVGVAGPYIFYHWPLLPKYFWLWNCWLGDYLQKLFSGFIGFRGMNFAVRRQIWKSAGGFNRSISALEDIDLARRVVRYGRIAYDRGLVVSTTDRRFRQDNFQSTLYRMGAYFYRIILKSDQKFRHWKQIRE